MAHFTPYGRTTPPSPTWFISAVPTSWFIFSSSTNLWSALAMWPIGPESKHHSLVFKFPIAKILQFPFDLLGCIVGFLAALLAWPGFWQLNQISLLCQLPASSRISSYFPCCTTPDLAPASHIGNLGFGSVRRHSYTRCFWLFLIRQPSEVFQPTRNHPPWTCTIHQTYRRKLSQQANLPGQSTTLKSSFQLLPSFFRVCPILYQAVVIAFET